MGETSTLAHLLADVTLALLPAEATLSLLLAEVLPCSTPTPPLLADLPCS